MQTYYTLSEFDILEIIIKNFDIKNKVKVVKKTFFRHAIVEAVANCAILNDEHIHKVVNLYKTSSFWHCSFLKENLKEKDFLIMRAGDKAKVKLPKHLARLKVGDIIDYLDICELKSFKLIKE